MRRPPSKEATALFREVVRTVAKRLASWVERHGIIAPEVSVRVGVVEVTVKPVRVPPSGKDDGK